MRYVTKNWLLIVLNGFFIKNVGDTLMKNYNGTYLPLGTLALFLATLGPLGLFVRPAKTRTVTWEQLVAMFFH